jgi:hypothetical protein
LKGRGMTSASSAVAPINHPQRAENVCLDLLDHSTIRRSAVDFFRLWNQRDPQSQAARMAEQFVKANRHIMSSLDVQVESHYDGSHVSLLISAGDSIGAIPLCSPSTARPDYGLVVQPRFPWAGIGPMLGEMGWRVTPTPLRLPLLHRSERRVPLWVLSSMVLVRLKALLDCLDRKFAIVSETLNAPRGRVDWESYATKSVPRANLLSIPCEFADLRIDPLLLGAIRYTLERQIRALDSQRQHGAFIHRLIEFGQGLLRNVQSVPAYLPSQSLIDSWTSRPLRAEHLVNGLQAIEWTLEGRGLRGLSDLQGIPWTMPMDQFFEAWVETVFGVVALQTNGLIKVARKRETTQPIAWEPPYLGSQKSLVPDIWIEWESLTLIVDAKYKRHWEEMQRIPWRDADDRFREDHRSDLLQVLAYANLARTPRVIVCLMYPCSPTNWVSLNERGRVTHKAEISIGARSIHIWLTAVPMAAGVGLVAAPLIHQVRSVLQ